MTQIRLLARCQFHGEVREPGYTFEMPLFETRDEAQAYLRTLPHTVADHGNPKAANYRADLHGTSIDAVTGGQYVGPIQMPVMDVPLFEIVGNEIELAPVAPVPAMPGNPGMVIQPSPAEPAPPAAPLVADHVTGALRPASDGAGETVTSQAELDEQEPVEEKPAEEAASAEDGPAAEGEAHDDESGDAPQV